MRIGIGYDVHRLTEGRPLILGGITVPHSKGLFGHSDADVLTHTYMDAMLGAANLGSIGDHFPDTDPTYKDADSIELLKVIYQRVQEKGYIIGNMDAVLVAQKPKLSPHIPAMQAHLATVLGLDIDQIGIKATTSEKLGYEGREEGISCQAVVLLLKA